MHHRPPRLIFLLTFGLLVMGSLIVVRLIWWPAPVYEAQGKVVMEKLEVTVTMPTTQQIIDALRQSIEEQPAQEGRAKRESQ